LLLLGPLLVLQRRLHYEMQAVFLLVTRHKEITVVLFSLLFFPGVLVHEGSHYLMARLLGVRTGRFSLIPRTTKKGRLQMGFVETGATDLVRDALIGAAPLIVGGAFVAYAGLRHLGLHQVWEVFRGGDLAAILDALLALPRQPDFWLWFYFVFAISSTMLPSASDRRAWLPLAVIVGFVLGVSVLIGAGPLIKDAVSPLLNDSLRAFTAVVGVTVAVHLALLPPIWGLRLGLSRLTGLQVR
jgi:hypothetical protein